VSDTIHPCPFCWGNGSIAETAEAGIVVRCDGCGARGSSRNDVRDAIFAWNTAQRRVEYSADPLTYDWLLANGWHKLERLDRQPFDHVRRCVGLELVQNHHFMIAPEDVCLDLAPNFDLHSKTGHWLCWLTRASAQNRHPSIWLHVRHLETIRDLAILYEGITGRQLGPPSWRRDKLARPIFANPKS